MIHIAYYYSTTSISHTYHCLIYRLTLLTISAVNTNHLPISLILQHLSIIEMLYLGFHTNTHTFERYHFHSYGYSIVWNHSHYSHHSDYFPFIKTWQDRELDKSHHSVILIADIVFSDYANVAALQNIKFGWFPQLLNYSNSFTHRFLFLACVFHFIQQ